jgi:hypothetical protein
MATYQKNQREEAMRMHREGYTINEILPYVDMSYDAVNRMLISKGLKVKKKPLEGASKILRLLRDGIDAAKIAHETNTGIAKVMAIGRASNIFSRNYFFAGNFFETLEEKEKYIVKVRSKVKRLAAEGLTPNEISDQCLLSPLVVADFLDTLHVIG